MIQRKSYFVSLFLLASVYILCSSYNAGITGKSINGCGGNGCHVMDNNTSILLTGIPSIGFQAGATYTMTLSVIHVGKAAAGFNLKCDIGNLIAGNGMLLNGTKELYHNSPQTIINTAGIASWTFDWKAPLQGTEVSFFVAGNAVDGNNQTTNDAFVTDAFYFNKDTITPNNIQMIVKEKEKVKVFPNPCHEVLFVEADTKAEIVMMNSVGQMITIKRQALNAHTQQINLHHLGKGNYWIGVNGIWNLFTLD